MAKHSTHGYLLQDVLKMVQDVLKTQKNHPDEADSY
jgi:hypothetical protein